MKRNENIKHARELFVSSVNAYLEELLRMFEWDAYYGYWVSDDVGGIYMYGDNDSLSFDEIRYIVDNNISLHTIEEWKDYCLSVAVFDIPTPSLEAWCYGCPHISKEKIKELEKLKSDLDKLSELCKEEVNINF